MLYKDNPSPNAQKNEGLIFVRIKKILNNECFVTIEITKEAHERRAGQ
jgi:hypothetical protein